MLQGTNCCRTFLSIFLVLVMLVGGVDTVPAYGQNTDTSLAGGKITNVAQLQQTYQRLSAELAQLKQKEEYYTRFETPLAEREAYVKKVIGLLRQLSALEAQLVEQPEESDPDAEKVAAKSEQPDSLILTGILLTDQSHDPFKTGKIYNKTGFARDECSPATCEKGLRRVDVVQVEDYPPVIRVGEPFNFKASHYLRMEVPAGMPPQRFSGGKAAMEILMRGLGPVESEGLSYIEAGRNVFVRQPNGGYQSKAWSQEDRVNLDVELAFEDYTYSQQKADGFRYTVSRANTNGELTSHHRNAVGRKLILEYPEITDDAQTAASTPPPFYVLVSPGGGRTLVFVYEFSDETRKALNPETFQPPDDVMANRVASAQDNADQAAQSPNDGNGDANTNGSTARGSGVDNRASQTGISGVAGASDGAINPGNPNVRALIDEWLNVAEPPPNATEGAQFTYEPWGRFVGRAADGGTVKAHSHPDAAAGMTSHQYVWGIKDQLDSVNHCTLGEYVEARLAKQNIRKCQGRYAMTMPDLIGMPEYKATRILANRGLGYQSTRGKDAPDAKLTGTVYSQSISPGTKLGKKKFVKLTYYNQPEGYVQVGDYTGKPVSEVRKDLQWTSLKVGWAKGAVAPSEQQNGQVEKQDPSPQTWVKVGSPLTLTVYQDRVRMVTVKNFTGMELHEAKALAQESGLKADTRWGAQTADTQKAGTVESQSPTPGTQLQEGAAVTLAIYKREVPMVTVPDLVGLSRVEAERELNRLLLTPQISAGAEARSSQYEGRVQKQHPIAGVRIKEGEPVTLAIYSQTQIRMPNLVGLSMEEAREKLASSGLRSDFVYGRPAQTSSQQGQVQGQYARPGQVMQKGETVRVVVFAPPNPAPPSNTGSNAGGYGSTALQGGNVGVMKFLKPSTNSERDRQVLNAWSPPSGSSSPGSMSSSSGPRNQWGSERGGMGFLSEGEDVNDPAWERQIRQNFGPANHSGTGASTAPSPYAAVRNTASSCSGGAAKPVDWQAMPLYKPRGDGFEVMAPYPVTSPDGRYTTTYSKGDIRNWDNKGVYYALRNFSFNGSNPNKYTVKIVWATDPGQLGGWMTQTRNEQESYQDDYRREYVFLAPCRYAAVVISNNIRDQGPNLPKSAFQSFAGVYLGFVEPYGAPR